jgi:hypothetical protein
MEIPVRSRYVGHTIKLDPNEGKLPKHVTPIAYHVELDLTPDLAKIPAATGTPALAFTGNLHMGIAKAPV